MNTWYCPNKKERQRERCEGERKREEGYGKRNGECVYEREREKHKFNFLHEMEVTMVTRG